MSSRQILLDTFADNNAHMITAADMRQFVESIYDETIQVDKIVNNLVSSDLEAVLGATQGAEINTRLALVESTSLTQDTQISSLQTQVSQLSSDISTLQAQVANLINQLSTGFTGSINTTINPTLNVSSGIVNSAV